MVLTFYRVDGKIRDFEEMELFELVDIADKLFELVDIKFFFVKIFDWREVEPSETGGTLYDPWVSLISRYSWPLFGANA